MHKSGGDFVVCCVRNERVALQFRCKVSLPTDSVCASRTVRCGQVTFCKMMPHLAIRLVAAVHFVLGARVSKDAFFVSQLRSCHKTNLDAGGVDRGSHGFTCGGAVSGTVAALELLHRFVCLDCFGAMACHLGSTCVARYRLDGVVERSGSGPVARHRRVACDAWRNGA